MALIAGVGVAAYSGIDALVQAQSWVEHTQEVLYVAEKLQTGLLQAETSVRGYYITGETDSLGGYHAALKLVRARLDDLPRLTADNSGQQARIARLAPIITERLALLAEVVDTRRSERTPAALPPVAAGKRLMDEIGSVITEITAEENALFRVRQQTAKEKAEWTLSLTLAGSASGVAGIAVGFLLLFREAGRRRTVEGQLQVTNEQLEDRVRQGIEEVFAANEMLIGIFESSPMPMYVLDDYGNTTMWNAAAENTFGYTAAEALGHPPPFVGPEDQSQFFSHFVRMTKGPSRDGIDVRRRRKDGTLLDLNVSWAPLRRRDGRLRGVINVAVDVTQRRQIEAQLRHSQKMEAIGHLTGGIAHDFNNLLGIVVGNLDIAAEQTRDSPQIGELLEEAQNAALRGAELTRRLLAFARQQPLQPRAVDINSLVAGAIPLLKRTLGENITITASPTEGLSPAVADPSQIEDALLNLTLNARDAMPDGGALTIETANVSLDEAYTAVNAEVTPGDYVMLGVTDTGTGIPPDILDHVLEPFFSTKEVGRGSGLGLSMVYGFVKQSRGHLKIYSEVGHGTTVKLYLPRAEAANTPLARPRSDVEELPVGSEWILVVEDNSAMRRTAVRILTDLGYRVHEAGDPSQALELLDRGKKVDLLFTDIVMPGRMLGTDLAREARLRRPSILVLFTTGYAQSGVTKARNFSLADEQVIAKPYRKLELAKKVRAALDSAEPHGSQ